MKNNVSYWLKSESVQNFGDYLTEFFLRELFYPFGMDARGVHLIGSVLDDLFVPPLEGDVTTKPVVFWGCGLRETGGLTPDRRHRARILSVRGPLSAAELRLGAAVPYGDPALLLPALYTPRQANNFRGKTVCIPHFHDQRSDTDLLNLSGCDLVLRPNIAPDPSEICRFIDSICTAEFVLSAAMHGAVVAAAYKKPFAFWDNGHLDVPFKWLDISASLNIQAVFKANLDDARSHYTSAIEPNITLPSLWPTLATAPLLLRPIALLKALRYDLRDCSSSEILSAIDARISEFEQHREHSETIVTELRLADAEGAYREGAVLREQLASSIDEVNSLKELLDSAVAEAREGNGLREQLAASIDEVNSLKELLDSAVAEAREGNGLREQLAASIDEVNSLKELLDSAVAEAREGDGLREQMAAFIAEVHALKERLETFDAEAVMLRRRSASATLAADRLRSRIAADTNATEQLRAQTAQQLQRLECEVDTGLSEITRLHSELRRANEAEAAYANSTSWKMTRPLRRIATRLPWAGRYGRRCLKLIWLACNPRLAVSAIVHRKDAPAVSPSEIDASVIFEEPSNGGSCEIASGESMAEPTLMRPGGQPVELASARNDDALQRACSQKPVVLMIDSVYPRPDKDSGSIDAMNYIKMFQNIGYQVIFVAVAEFSLVSTYRDALEALGVYCVSQPQHESVTSFLRTAGTLIDVCFLSRVYCGGAYVEQIRLSCLDAKIIFNTVDLHHLREEREARLQDDRRGINLATGTREREISISRLSDATIVVSRLEEELLAEAAPGSTIHMLPLIRECPGRRNSFDQRHDIGFIGGFNHRPNIDAVHYFLNEIWPLIRVQLPNMQFFVMGADMPDEIKQRTDPGFVPVGYVADLTERLEAIRLMVAPLRFGAGAKGKVATSLAHGVPCVTSRVAAEGMMLTDGKTIAIGDTPAAFAQQVVEIYSSETRWTSLSDAGIASIVESNSFPVGQKLMVKLLSEIKAPVPQHA
ncbi:glycosyl transferase, group 1 [Caballeronia choica]|uniref:Glycosyl transferase, group 1 n=1 Tax=Caballeronia choica TaxID=326476 RepID=A0A158L0A7_9BURK|nr:glycosyltransferase [Caballeronia choica]SAL86290.1 glycosyl transferase, group 1 [Caballeronia choica]